MKHFIFLLRPLNVLLLAGIQFLMYISVIQPIMQIHGFAQLPQNNLSIWLLLAATALITAGGYVLNDYFDVKIDLINRPDRVIVTRTVSKSAAMLLYQILSGTGVIIGVGLAVWLGSVTLGFIFPVSAGLLWFYSASYKRQLITGNLTVAFLAAISVLSVGILQVAFLQKIYGTLIFETKIPPVIYLYIGGFAAFAFLSTWIREIIKDCEDVEGDSEMECRTMPIKWGMPKTKIVLYAFIALTICALLFVSQKISFSSTLTFRYVLFGAVLPLLALGYLIFTARTARDFHQAATFTKICMLAGVLYSIVFYFEIARMFKIPFFNLFIVQ